MKDVSYSPLPGNASAARLITARSDAHADQATKHEVTTPKVIRIGFPCCLRVSLPDAVVHPG